MNAELMMILIDYLIDQIKWQERSVNRLFEHLKIWTIRVKKLGILNNIKIVHETNFK